ncbi:hypothetical protein Tco_0480447 [Tanacetum coccineum]
MDMAYVDSMDTPYWELNNPEGKEYPFDLSKPLPLIMELGRQVVHADLFFNNDLEYLKEGSSRKKYTTSTTKTKAVNYDILGIEDMVPSLWSLVKFKEGDFPGLHLHDIEDMLLLLVQKKLSNLDSGVLFDLVMALQMFTRRIVILKFVKDLQLGVKSYQKKLNITKLETFKSDISDRTPYTAYNNPQGIIYEDKSVLDDITTSNLRLDYLPKSRWSSLDKKRSRIMIKVIDKLLLERRLMRSLEKFVGGKDYRKDLRLLQQTI